MSWVGKPTTDFGNTPTDGPDGSELSGADPGDAGSAFPRSESSGDRRWPTSALPVAAASGLAT